MPSWQNRPSAVCILAIGGLFVVAFLILEHSPVGREVNGDLLGFMNQGVVVALRVVLATEHESDVLVQACTSQADVAECEGVAVHGRPWVNTTTFGSRLYPMFTIKRYSLSRCCSQCCAWVCCA